MPNFHRLIELSDFKDDLATLYSFEGSLTDSQALDQTVQHYLSQTLRRENIDTYVAVRSDLGQIALFRDGISAAQASALEQFADDFIPRYLQMLTNAQAALQVLPIIKARGPRTQQDVKPWDPDQVNRPNPALAWRPFFGHGLTLSRQKCVQLFHYPPLRLLQEYRDYLNDPVPAKVELLLLANLDWNKALEWSQWTPEARQTTAPYFLAQHERVIDGCPIAAPDDQGSKPVTDAQGHPICDENGKQFVGLMPIEDFLEYQRAELMLHLIPHAVQTAYSIPLNIFGEPARKQFEKLTGRSIPADVVSQTPVTGHVQIKSGQPQTPFIAWWHPYEFYWRAHGRSSETIGKGQLVMTQKTRHDIEGLLVDDLALAGWSLAMAEDPSQDPQATLQAQQAKWNRADTQPQVQALVRHLASFEETGPNKLGYAFCESLPVAWGYVQAHPDLPYGVLPVE